jgi:hypothetical protein
MLWSDREHGAWSGSHEIGRALSIGDVTRSRIRYDRRVMAAVDDVSLAFQIADILREPPAKVARRMRELREARQAKAKPKRPGQAARTRRYRQRLRQGLMVLQIEVPRIPVTEALIAASRISPEASLFRGQLEEAAGRVLADWAERQCSRPRGKGESTCPHT